MKLLILYFFCSFYAYSVIASEVYKAVENSDLVRLKQLIEDGANLNEPMECMIDEEEYYSSTPLSKAIEMKRIDLVDILLTNGASCTRKYGTKIALHGSKKITYVSTPLEEAISSMNLEILMLILKYSFDDYAESESSSSDSEFEESIPECKRPKLSENSALSLLLENCNMQQAVVLFSYGVNPYSQSEDSAFSPIQVAMEKHNYLIVALYIFWEKLEGLQISTIEDLQEKINNLPWLQISSIIAILKHQISVALLPSKLQALFP